MRNVGGTLCTTGCFIRGRGIPLSYAVRIGHDASAPCWACSLQPTMCRDRASTPHNGVYLHYNPNPAALSCTDQKGVRPYPYGNRAPLQPLFWLQGSCVTELGQVKVSLPLKP